MRKKSYRMVVQFVRLIYRQFWERNIFSDEKKNVVIVRNEISPCAYS